MSLRKEAMELGGIGTRSLQNKITRNAKHRNDRQVHKRRRQKNKKEIENEIDDKYWDDYDRLHDYYLDYYDDF